MIRIDGKRVRACRSFGGFTLTELLVVISIIALRVSITLPTLTRAQRDGEAIHCLANERQIMFAWMQYAADSDDALCVPRSYRTALKRYADMNDVFICKGVQDESVTNSYGIASVMGGESRDGIEAYEKLHKVSRPSERLVLVDVESESQTCFWPLMWSRKRWTWRPWSWPPTASLQGMTARHSNGCNLSFADGHGQYKRWKDSRTLKLIKGQLADPNRASRENGDLDHMVEILTH